DRDAVADHHALATELACLHRGDAGPPTVRAQRAGEAAPVDSHDPTLLGLLVARPVLAPRPRLATPRSYAHVVLVEVATPLGGAHAASIRCQRSTKSGMVLPVVATSTTRTPRTASPTTAAAVASRWSSCVANTPPCRVAGWTDRPSCVSTTSAPRPPSSLVRAASRSVSWPRRCATPRTVVGD